MRVTDAKRHLDWPQELILLMTADVPVRCLSLCCWVQISLDEIKCFSCLAHRFHHRLYFKGRKIMPFYEKCICFYPISFFKDYQKEFTKML